MSIYLKKSKYKNGRIFLSIINGYYDSITKNTKHTVIESPGFVDVLEKDYDDPIAYFTDKANKMNEERQNNNIITKNINLNQNYLIMMINIILGIYLSNQSIKNLVLAYL